MGDIIQYLKARLQAPKPMPQVPNRSRSNAVTARPVAAPMTQADREAETRQRQKMAATRAQISSVDWLLNVAMHQYAIPKDPLSVQPLREAIRECRRMQEEISDATVTGTGISGMKGRQQILENILQKIADMADVVNTAVEFVSTVDVTTVTRIVTDMQSSRGYIDTKLMHTLGLIRPSRFNEPFGH